MGLGNPGPRYELTRHNVGYRVIDLILENCQNHDCVSLKRKRFTSVLQAKIPGYQNQCPVTLVRWMGYMNESGRAIPGIKKNSQFLLENFYVILDNMDLEPGICRLKKGGGNAGHNGLKSIIYSLGSSDFNRLYIGVGRPSHGIDVVRHVLSPPKKTDAESIEQACRRAADALLALREDNYERISEKLNRREGWEPI